DRGHSPIILGSVGWRHWSADRSAQGLRCPEQLCSLFGLSLSYCQPRQFFEIGRERFCLQRLAYGQALRIICARRSKVALGRRYRPQIAEGPGDAVLILDGLVSGQAFLEETDCACVVTLV